MSSLTAITFNLPEVAPCASIDLIFSGSARTVVSHKERSDKSLANQSDIHMFSITAKILNCSVSATLVSHAVTRNILKTE